MLALLPDLIAAGATGDVDRADLAPSTKLDKDRLRFYIFHPAEQMDHRRY
jgi:hypothetical protein